MEIRLAATDEEILACFPVLHQLRTHLRREEFVARVREQQTDGYRLAFLVSGGAPVTVAGFRIQRNLAWGRFLYVDDLVTASAARSRGYGKVVLEWLFARAAEEGCDQVHLDSGVEKSGAHRFYRRDGMRLSSYHFCRDMNR